MMIIHSIYRCCVVRECLRQLTNILLPYTTLFRSFTIPIVVPSSPTKGAVEPVVARKARPRFRLVSSSSMLRSIARDRKSTRLNSSHLVISYAVFCLTKQNNTSVLYTYVLLYRFVR